MSEEIILKDPELQMLINNKEEGFNYRERREQDWRENYELSRDRVQINRLTQRQSVNLPIMKTTEFTVLKDIDDMPVIEYQNLDNNKEAQTFFNEYWKHVLDVNHAEILDIVDKKQEFFFGRTFDSWQVIDGMVKWEIEDPEDMLVSRFMNPYNIDSSRFLIHTHIFKPLSTLVGNPEYNQEEVKKLVEFFETQMGIVKAKDNENTLQQKNQKMANLGVSDVEDPVLGETYVELTMHRVFRPKGEEWTDKDGKKHKSDEEEIFSYIEAENQCILQKMPQEKLIGKTEDDFWKTHYNYDSWAGDVDKQDFWTDGKADLVRTPNKIANAWFSQEIERRTLSNFGMTFYDSTKAADGFMPNTYQPKPFGFYGVPGKPKDFLQRVEIPTNDGNLQSIEFITQFVEKATGATPGQQGITPPAGTPLGTTQIVEGEAKARTQSISKFYTKAWEQRGLKFLRMVEAASDKLDAVKIFKKGKNTNDLFEREITPKDWTTKSGYRVKVWSQDEKNNQDTEAIKKLQLVKIEMPFNPKLNEVYKRKLLEFADLTPDEVSAIMEAELQALTNPMLGANNGMGAPGQVQPQPAQPMPQI